MLELEIIKQHCRLEPDFTADDELLDTYSNAARRYIENRTDRALYATEAEIPLNDEGEPDTDNSMVLDDDLTTAMLLLIGHWYANREAVITGTNAETVPLAVDALVQPYKVYGV